jgi:hypothetical protein
MVMTVSPKMTLCDYGLVSELFRACFLLDLFENTHKGVYLFSHCPGTQKVDLAFHPKPHHVHPPDPTIYNIQPIED